MQWYITVQGVYGVSLLSEAVLKLFCPHYSTIFFFSGKSNWAVDVNCRSLPFLCNYFDLYLRGRESGRELLKRWGGDVITFVSDLACVPPESSRRWLSEGLPCVWSETAWTARRTGLTSGWSERLFTDAIFCITETRNFLPLYSILLLSTLSPIKTLFHES
jgi:hypothetical protein